MTESRKSTMKTKNKILAIDAAPEAIPPKPKTAAIMATIRKITVQRNIVIEIKVYKICLLYSPLHYQNFVPNIPHPEFFISENKVGIFFNILRIICFNLAAR